ncbi:MAG: hypothetical protein ABI220_01805 [Candidatus Saccharimonadales bacterium]
MNESSRDLIRQNQLVETLIAPQPVVIGLEGGPCSGKTTLAEEVCSRSEADGRAVVVIPEAATIHISRLAALGKTMPEVIANRPAFLQLQRDILGTIIDNISRAKLGAAGTDTIILVDRPDVGGYITSEEYKTVLEDVGQTMPPIHSLVDKLIFLPSVATESPERYAALQGTNTARYETSAEVAAAVGAANLRAIKTHPELYVAWGGSFPDKVRSLAAMILSPEIEGEIKQAVPNEAAETFLGESSNKGNLLNTMEITQSYYKSRFSNYRLRTSRGDDGFVHRYFTVKQGEGVFRNELQRSLDENQYQLLARGQRVGRVLHKLRHVILDDEDVVGKRRLWFADKYTGPYLSEWHFETGVDTRAEAQALQVAYAGTRRAVIESAKALIFK